MIECLIRVLHHNFIVEWALHNQTQQGVLFLFYYKNTDDLEDIILLFFYDLKFSSGHNENFIHHWEIYIRCNQVYYIVLYSLRLSFVFWIGLNTEWYINLIAKCFHYWIFRDQFCVLSWTEVQILLQMLNKCNFISRSVFNFELDLTLD